ncbi:MAG: hypothetical protein P1U36_00120 [Legionellaceae bacterium]|nr:hypothetical protein [Legionellaceae bacterium]
MSVFKLYNFVSKHLDVLRRKGFDLEEARAPREAFYGNLTAADAVFAKQAESGLWTFDSQHITIEKNVDPDNPAMGPHWTLRYRHKKDPALMCVVHAYFNKKMVPNGCYQQRVIQTAQDGTEIVIFSDKYHEGKMAGDSPYPGISLSLYQIKDLAAIGARMFTALDAERAEKYVELYQEIQIKESEITEILHHKAEGYLDKASVKVGGLRPVIDELNLYTDGQKDFTDVPIIQQIQALKDASTRRVKPSSQHVAVESIAWEEQEQTTAQTVPKKQTQAQEREKIEKESMQTQLLDLLNHVLQMQQENDTETHNFYHNLQEFNALCMLFELIHETAEDKAFLATQRAQLPETYLNLSDHFKQAIYTGNLPIVQAMFGTVRLDMDWVLLFSELLDILESGKNDDLCECLIPVVYYLHEHSDLLQAFVLFKMTRLEYSTEKGLFDGKFQINLLSMMYWNDNFRAYRLYLNLGCSPEGSHARCGQVAFNALQALMLISNDASNRELYVEELFKHGAVKSITPHLIPYDLVSHAILKNTHVATNPAAVSTTLFHHTHQQSRKKIKASRIINKSGVKTECLPEDKKNLEFLMKQENILEFSSVLYQIKNPGVVGLMARYCDMKTCLLEFSNLIVHDCFTIVFRASTQGGAAFHLSDASLERDSQNHMNFLDTDNLMMFTQGASNQEPIWLAQRKTMRAYVTFNPKYPMSEKEKEGLLSSTELVYQEFERSFQILSDEEKRCFIETLMKLVVQRKLAGASLVETLKLYLAVITSNSLINSMVAEDYRRMIKFFLGYGKAFDELTEEPTLIPVQTYINLTNMFIDSGLNPKILEVISTEIIDMFNLRSARMAEWSDGMALKCSL